MASRTYHDPLHRGIRLESRDPAEAMVLSLVDSAPFQRLRRIRQLGPAFLTFHGAESSRFTHSLGVFSIARRAMERLRTLDPSLEEQRGVLYGAALLHDLGHAPLSHTGEEMFGTHHEQWSARVIREHPEIRDSLEGYASGTADAVADLLEHGRTDRGVIKSLVSSQLDCDRLDYLLRDSYSTGARYGQLDLDRILAAITLAPDGELAIHPKGLMAVEHYLVVRNLMYRSVYNHRLNVMCNWLLERLIQEARHLGPDRIWTDSTMHRWLWESERLDLDSYIANDDLRVGYSPAALAGRCPCAPGKPLRSLPQSQAAQSSGCERSSDLRTTGTTCSCTDDVGSRRTGPHPLLRVAAASASRLSPLSGRTPALGWSQLASP